MMSSVIHDGKFSKYKTNLRFTDDIDTLAEKEQDLKALVECLCKTGTMCKMKISAEKNKLMANSTYGI